MTAKRQIRNIALIGFMGAGKSSVGKLVARSLGFDYFDTDEFIEAHTGKTITRIFAEEGEAAFRELERQVVKHLEKKKNTVISTGGGLPANEKNLASLKSHALVVYLWASPQKLWQRVRNQTHRPLLQTPDPLAKIQQLLAARQPFYSQADVLVNTERRTVAEVARHVIKEFRAATALKK